MSTHSTTNRLAAALAFCDMLEDERRRRQAIREQERQEKIQRLGVVKEQRSQKNTKLKCDYVYIIKASNGYYKIGISRNPDKRFKELQRDAATWAIELELVHIIATNKAYILEQSLHKRFAEQRVRGEWFLLAQSDIEWLRAH